LFPTAALGHCWLGGSREVSCAELLLAEPLEVWGEPGLLHPSLLHAGISEVRGKAKGAKVAPHHLSCVSPGISDTLHGEHWAGAPLQ